MRLQHLTQLAASVPSGDPERAAAKAVIVEEVERLRWRLWNGKAQDAGISIERIRAVMHQFRGEPKGRHSVAPARQLWAALRALNDYLTSQSDWLVNYAERHRAGLRVGTSLTEGTANFLVNRRMNKAQQMRWTRHGADRLLQVRCAVYNGTLHTAAYWLMLTVRDAIPKPQPLATAEFATLRMRLLKIAGRITETATRVRIAFAAACPEAELFRGVARSLQLAGP